MASGLTPRKQPRQERSRQTCEAILEAAARILETEGTARFTTNRVAARAGVSIGSLYQYFPSKEAILAGLIRELRKELLLDLELAVVTARGKPVTSAVEILLRAGLQHHCRRQQLAYILERVEAGLPLDVETQELKRRILFLVKGFLEELAMENVEETAFDLIAIVHGLAEAATSSGETDMDALFLRLRKAAFGYLGLDWRQDVATGAAPDLAGAV